MHSRYERRLSDLPWEGLAVQLRIQARKFFCRNDECGQRIFCERLEELAAPFARRTLRLNEMLTAMGFALGGRPGKRLAGEFSIVVSARTLLRRMRASNVSNQAPVRVLGVDDFALRRGQRYGTILVDQEKHQAIDILPDREAKTLEQWLRLHPEVEIITRDRAPAYTEGAKAGAPQAQQIADRFHLLKNLTEALEAVLNGHRAILQTACDEAGASGMNADQNAIGTQPASAYQQRLAREKQQRRDRRLHLYEEVLRLRKEGAGLRAIARSIGLSRQTVRKYIRADVFPELAKRKNRANRLSPFMDYLRQRWADGCHNPSQLWREIRKLGFKGTDSVVRYHLREWRDALPPHLQRRNGIGRGRKKPCHSPRQVVWWLLKPSADLEVDEQKFVQHLLEISPEIRLAKSLAGDFQEMVRHRRVNSFDAWCDSVKKSGLKELQTFAAGLIKDGDAVRAALRLHWSNGQVEGQVNRLKMIKRQMYGRGNLDLLRSRVLHAS